MPAIIGAVALEAVQLLRLPGRCVALVSAEVAEVGERMNELRRLDRPHVEDRQRSAPQPPKDASYGVTPACYESSSP